MLEAVIATGVQEKQKKGKSTQQVLEEYAQQIACSRSEDWMLGRYTSQEYLIEQIVELHNFKWDLGYKAGLDIGEQHAVELFKRYCLDEFTRKYVIVNETGLVEPTKSEKVMPRSLSPAGLEVYEGSVMTLQLRSRNNNSIIYFYNGKPEEGVLIDANTAGHATMIFDIFKENPHYMTHYLRKHSGEIIDLKSDEVLFGFILNELNRNIAA